VNRRDQARQIALGTIADIAKVPLDRIREQDPLGKFAPRFDALPAALYDQLQKDIGRNE